MAEWYAIGNKSIPIYQKIDNNQNKLHNNKFYYYFDIFKCFFGICISYLIWGLVQERVMTKGYTIFIHNQKKFIYFKDSDFIIFVNRLFTFVTGLFIMSIKKCIKNRNNSNLIVNQGDIAPFYIYSYSSISNLISSICQYESLKYISFPTQVFYFIVIFIIKVVIKACKLVPVMIMNSIISKKIYKKNQYIVAILLCCGFALFLYGNLQDNYKNTTTFTNSLIWGISLSLGYLIFDSFTSTWQVILFYFLYFFRLKFLMIIMVLIVLWL